jgi:hypothetical protein
VIDRFMGVLGEGVLYYVVWVVFGTGSREGEGILLSRESSLSTFLTR